MRFVVRSIENWVTFQRLQIFEKQWVSHKVPQVTRNGPKNSTDSVWIRWNCVKFTMLAKKFNQPMQKWLYCNPGEPLQNWWSNRVVMNTLSFLGKLFAILEPKSAVLDPSLLMQLLIPHDDVCTQLKKNHIINRNLVCSSNVTNLVRSTRQPLFTYTQGYLTSFNLRKTALLFAA